MKKDPPHLPPRACRIDTHERMARLRWVLFVVFLAFISGVAASLSTVAWIAPVFVNETAYFGVGHSSSVSAGTKVDPLMIKQAKQRTVTVYDKNKKVDNSFYMPKSEVLEAAYLSSDGWAVAFYPNFVPGEERNWEAVDYQGSIRKVERTVYDPFSRLLYIKTSGQGFRIASFVDWSRIDSGYGLWSVRGSEWEFVVADDLENVSLAVSYPVWRPRFLYSLSPDAEKGSLLFDSQGGLAGISDENSRIIPGWMIEEQMDSLLERGRISYQGLPWSGYQVSGVKFEDRWQPLQGWYISDAPSRASSSTIGWGDVLVGIDGQPISNSLNARQVFLSPDEFVATVWRQGEEVDILVKKQIVSG